MQDEEQNIVPSDTEDRNEDEKYRGGDIELPVNGLNI